VLELRKRAGEEAARVAPYVHSRIGYAVGDEGGHEDFVPLAERIKEYNREDYLKAAGPNIVGLPTGN
jgi:hypothetical protein